MRQIGGHTQTFINRHQIGQAADIKIRVADALFNPAARHKQAAFQIPCPPAGRGIDKNLLNLRHTGEGDFAEDLRSDRHFTPACDKQCFVCQLFFDNIAAVLCNDRVLTEKQHPDCIITRQPPFILRSNHLKETIGFL